MAIALKRTPLYAEHVKLGGRIIDFGGWELPVQYEVIIKEHRMVRESAGLFDVSHMGEIIVRGHGAQDFVQYLVTNDVSQVVPKQTQYSPMCYPTGGCVDDLIVYKFSDDHFFIVVNASNTDKDFDWMTKHAPCGLKVENVSKQFAQLAIQGPKAQEILQKLTDFDLNTIRFFHFEAEVVVDGCLCIVSRTGYTGEDGFEVYANAQDAAQLWNAILAAGGAAVAPIGLGARDTLRFEAKLPLYGQEISQDITPLEAGLGYFVKLDKEVAFIGRDALRKQKLDGLKRCECEFEMLQRSIPRSHYQVVSTSGEEIGFVTTGMFAPTLEKNMGIALLPMEYKVPGTKIGIIIRDKVMPAEVKKGIFYSKKTRKD
ncbi:MAG: glycine cleavage system aminomethyltransferase GcvT [Thermoguttaceae bacterium]|nr:glycine cleavage system aminomethyltransferase GcvT [Thermoguttaceae bacterium]